MSLKKVAAAGGVLLALLTLEVALRIGASRQNARLPLSRPAGAILGGAPTFDPDSFDAVAGTPRPRHGGDFTLGEIIRPHPDDRIVYELRPDLRGRFVGQELATNSLGMRGSERAITKPEGTFRIVGVGDSVMFGWGVAEPESYLQVLERELNPRFPSRRFEAWNLAVPGYNTVQEVETFASKADRLAPDLMIIGWVGNDADLPNFLARRDPWSLERSFLAEIVEQRLASLRGGPVPSGALFEVPADPTSGRLLASADEIPERYRPLIGWDNMVAAFRRLARIAKERQIPAIALFDAGPRNLKDSCAQEGLLVAESQHRVLRYESEHHVDRYTALRLSRADSHPNALGHRLIAETLIETMLRGGVLRDDSRAE